MTDRTLELWLFGSKLSGFKESEQVPFHKEQILHSATDTYGIVGALGLEMGNGER